MSPLFMKPWLYLDLNGDDSGSDSGNADEGKEEGKGDGKTGKDGKAGDGKAAKGADFEAWLADQPEDVQEMYEAQVSKLKGALTNERTSNKEAKRAAARLKELEDAETARKNADLTELEKAKQDLADAQATATKARTDLDTERKKNAVMQEATGKKFRHPHLAFKLVDLASFEVDDDGTVSGVADALDALVKEFPYLVEGKEDKKKESLGTPRGGEKRKGEDEKVASRPVHF